MTSIGKHIKIARTDLGLSQIELSERLGITQASISQYESESRIPSIETLEAISAVLGVSLDDLGCRLEGRISIESADLTAQETLLAIEFIRFLKTRR